MIVFIMFCGSVVVTSGDNAYSLSLTINNSQVSQNSSVTISGSVANDNTPFAGTPVKIKVVNEKNTLVFVEQVDTDKDGKYKAVFYLSDTADRGKYTVTASAVGISESGEFTVVKSSTGGSGGSSGSSPSTPSQPAQRPKDDNQEKNSKKFDSKGGQVATEDGNLKIDVPEGAFDGEATISIRELTDEEQEETDNSAELDGFKIVSRTYDFNIDDNVTFRKPVTVKFILDDEAMEGKDKRLLGVYRYNPESNRWQYVGGRLNDEGAMEVQLDRFSIYTVIYYEKVFDDMINHWAKDAVMVTTAKHITRGVTDNLYAPDENVTRAQFAALLVRALNLQHQSYEGMFSDVEEDAWYAVEVEAAARAGLVVGSNGKFNPNVNITREAMATMLVRALKHEEGYSAPPITTDATTTKIQQYNDKEEISGWAQEYINTAIKSGLMQGMSPSTFAPRETATRAQAATTIFRLLEKLNRI